MLITLISNKRKIGVGSLDFSGPTEKTGQLLYMENVL